VYLLDTHALIWAIGSPGRLPAGVRAAVESRQAKLSVVSLWELIVKKTRRAASVREPIPCWDQHVARAEAEVIPIRVTHVATLDGLPDIHADPFDRMLVAQALAEGLTLASADAVLGQYGVPVVWPMKQPVQGANAQSPPDC
jgi:PIN domain nuclease of toxin-antitoxin system